MKRIVRKFVIAGKPGSLVSGTAKQASPHNIAASRKKKLRDPWLVLLVAY